jgi:hypothetical protein
MNRKAPTPTRAIVAAASGLLAAIIGFLAHAYRDPTLPLLLSMALLATLLSAPRHAALYEASLARHSPRMPA